MSRVKIIGIGACGNKATIQCLEDGNVVDTDILLLNSTLKDIPEKYKEYAIEFGNIKGCGKERQLAAKMLYESMGNNEIDIDKFVDPDTKTIIFVTSSEGGTGSGATIMLARYCKEILKIKNIHIFIIAGFEDDVRGLKNTVDIFNELSEDYIVEAISNKKFLESGSMTRAEAEALANKEFSQKVSILLGNHIVPSDKNIDDRDLYKLTNTPGYMTVEYYGINKLKSSEDFDAMLEDMIECSKSLETEVGAMRIGVIMNITKKNRAFVDEEFKVLRKAYGNPYEFFTHIQDTGEDEFIHIIVSGMKLPIDYIKKTYDSYKKQMEHIDLNSDKFFSSRDKFDTSLGNKLNFSMDDVDDFSAPKESVEDIKKAKDSFFNSFSTANKKIKQDKTSKFTNTVTNEL
jgi:cell division GTPase FtsZ